MAQKQEREQMEGRIGRKYGIYAFGGNCRCKRNAIYFLNSLYTECLGKIAGVKKPEVDPFLGVSQVEAAARRWVEE